MAPHQIIVNSVYHIAKLNIIYGQNAPNTKVRR